MNQEKTKEEDVFDVVEEVINGHVVFVKKYKPVCSKPEYYWNREKDRIKNSTENIKLRVFC